VRTVAVRVAASQMITITVYCSEEFIKAPFKILFFNARGVAIVWKTNFMCDYSAV